MAIAKAQQLREQHRWSLPSYYQVRSALIELLAEPLAPGARITRSRVRQVGATVKRTVEVLAALDLFDDDATPSIDRWIQRKTADLAPGFQSDVSGWLTELRHGHSRSRPRTDQTLYSYYGAVVATLIGWGERYATLREVTRDDVLTALAPLVGRPRGQLLVGMRSLFGYCRRKNRIFRDPTSRVHEPRVDPPLHMPLDAEAISSAVAFATTPALRLILALAAIHGARPQAIRLLTLDDLDLPNHRITIAGYNRRLDDLTAGIARDYLAERHARWPYTSNPHVLVSRLSASGRDPVSTYYFKQHFVPAGIRLDAIRRDRLLEEALTHGPDPLRLCAMFGLDRFAAMRVAALAQRILDPPESDPHQIQQTQAIS